MTQVVTDKEPIEEAIEADDEGECCAINFLPSCDRPKDYRSYLQVGDNR